MDRDAVNVHDSVKLTQSHGGGEPVFLPLLRTITPPENESAALRAPA
jgi:hypothetical protein